MTELGSRFKEAREQQNLSLEDVQAMTKIQKRYLEGIEEGNFALMPGKFYVRAFIKQYAEALGLDPEMVFAEYKDEIPNTHNENLPEQLSRVQSRRIVSAKSEKIIGVLPKVLTVVVIFLAAVAIWVIAQKISSSQHEQLNGANNTNVISEESPTSPLKTKKKAKQSQAAKNTADQTNNADNSAGQAQAQSVQKVDVVQTNNGKSTLQLSNTDKFNLEVGSTGKTWVQISNSTGKVFYSGVLTPNSPPQINDFTNESEILLNIGNSPDTVLKINGEEIPFPVDPKVKIVQQIKILFQKQ